MPAQQAERNRDLEIATCTANRPVVPLRLQSRFLNRGSFPELAESTNFVRDRILLRLHGENVLANQKFIFKSGFFLLYFPRIIQAMPLDLRINEIFPISDFVRNASAHTARIRETNRVEILTQHGRPSLAVMPAEQYERLIHAAEYLDSVEAVRVGLEAAEAGHSKPASAAIHAWEAL